ncbi:MAG TPA: threonine synthase [Methylomirabilota bacterium]|jgi:threonine synthase|nr:threonine synthase [Methylomirabilota bacterium]
MTWRSYLTHLDCTACGLRHDADQPQSVCRSCGKVLYARYDLNALRQDVRPLDFAGRRWDMWRYSELLPVREEANVVTLGEGLTPLLSLRAAAAQAIGLEHGALLVKDEGQNPTATFKARGLAVAVSRARELGITAVALPSAGNAGAAAAAYAAAAGLTAHVAMPRDVPAANRSEAAVYGAEIMLVEGLIDDAGRLIRERAARDGWFDLSTLREPYRQEGKKTLGIELAEQGGWGADCLPDVVIYPTGGGTGIVGMWKAFAELEALGWIGPRRPKMVVVQAEGCAPIVRAYERGETHAEPWPDAHTIAAGIRVPAAIGDYLILEAVRASGGTAVAVTDGAIRDAQLEMGRLAGIYAAPEGAATWAAAKQLRASGFLDGYERVVLFNTGMGLKYEPPTGMSF